MSQENVTGKQPLIRYVNRRQMSWRAVDVEKLIGEDHPARAIWTLVGRLDLSSFYRVIESSVEARAHSRRRGPVVEFCHAWIKTKLGLRQFHVRGLEKVGTELLWACLTYNLQQWIRLSKPDTAAAG